MTATARRSPPPELPAVAGFQQYARFERVNGPSNRERSYLLAVQPTLVGDIALMRTWGRIGTHDHSLSSTFPDRARAQQTVERLIRRRIQRRYELVAWT
jgi:predicted DNA-binding WGR domain protein